MEYTNFISSEGRIIKTSPMKDEHQIIKITEKTPVVQNIGKIVRGDTNSNILTFEINRYYDNVDLYTKNIRFIVKNGEDVFIEKAVNLQYNTSLLRFSWILSHLATYKVGNIIVAVEFYSEVDSKCNYSLKTIPFEIKIENTLDISDINVIDENDVINLSPIPIATVIKNGNISTFTVTDKNGTTSVNILDGKDGITPHIDSVTKHWFIGTTDTGIVAEGLRGETGDTGQQGVQGIKGDKGDDGYPFLIYKEYDTLLDFDSSDFPEVGLMFMIKTEDENGAYPVYRYTGEDDEPYSHITGLLNGEGIKGDKGDKGDTGAQGIPGQDGITYKPIIGTVTYGEQAEASVVTNDETKIAQFNFVLPQGEKGNPGKDGTTYTPTIGTVTSLETDQNAIANVVIDETTNTASFNFSIPKGKDGVGIEKIEKIDSEESVDVYRITLTDGNTYDFNVANGSTDYNNIENKPCINGIELVGNITLEDIGIDSVSSSDDIDFSDMF